VISLNAREGGMTTLIAKIDRNLGSRTGLVMRIVHSRKQQTLGSPSRECAITRATIPSSQADVFLFPITKPVGEPLSWRKRKGSGEKER